MTKIIRLKKCPGCGQPAPKEDFGFTLRMHCTRPTGFPVGDSYEIHGHFHQACLDKVLHLESEELVPGILDLLGEEADHV